MLYALRQQILLPFGTYGASRLNLFKYITRTHDFVNWEIGKYNPFLQTTNEDGRVLENASSEITDEMREIIKTGYFCSVSGQDYCEFNGKTTVNYIVGNQRGLGFIAEAIYNGLLSGMLENFFD